MAIALIINIENFRKEKFMIKIKELTREKAK
jgi:hypothetical protein